MGYTPEIVTGVWIGFDQAKPLGRKESGARSALPIWVDVMQIALQGRPIQLLSKPPSIATVNIDPKTGKLATPGGPSVEEVFLSGTEPTEPSSGETDFHLQHEQDDHFQNREPEIRDSDRL